MRIIEPYPALQANKVKNLKVKWQGSKTFYSFFLKWNELYLNLHDLSVAFPEGPSWLLIW